MQPIKWPAIWRVIRVRLITGGVSRDEELFAKVHTVSSASKWYSCPLPGAETMDLNPSSEIRSPTIKWASPVQVGTPSFPR